eukprot:gene11194-17216_t
MGVADNVAQALERTVSLDDVVVEGRYRTSAVLRAPLPEAKSSEPPPAVRREMERAERENALAARTQEYHEKKKDAETKEKLSFKEKAQAKLDSMSHKVDKMKTETIQSAHEKVAAKMDKDAEDRFRKHFPHLHDEKLVYHDYYCTLIHNISPDDRSLRHLDGYLLVTNQSILFIQDSSKSDPVFRIELRNVVSIRRAVKLDTIDVIPHCMPLPTSRVIPQGIIVYTRKGWVHRFFDFKPTVGTATGNLSNKAFGIVDWAWREVQGLIPVPDYEYEGQTKHVDPLVTSLEDLKLKAAVAAGNTTAAAQNAAAALNQAKTDPKTAILQAKMSFG